MKARSKVSVNSLLFLLVIIAINKTGARLLWCRPEVAGLPPVCWIKTLISHDHVLLLPSVLIVSWTDGVHIDVALIILQQLLALEEIVALQLDLLILRPLRLQVIVVLGEGIELGELRLGLELLPLGMILIILDLKFGTSALRSNLEEIVAGAFGHCIGNNG